MASRADDAMLPRVFAVRRRRRETHDVWTLQLDGAPHEDYRPGQWNMLYVYGNGEIPVSISGDPAARGALVHTVRAVGAVSEALTQLPVGTGVGVRGPFGSAWPVEEAVGGDVVLIAGGLGLAPLRPAVYSILAQRQRYGEVALLCGARSAADLLYRSELQRWRRAAHMQVHTTVDHADKAWRGNVGVVTTLIPAARFDPARALAMVCGPEVMMRFAIAALLAAGMAPDRIYLSMERNMQCSTGHCGRCQFGPFLICRDGAVLRYDRVAHLLGLREI
jgi:NAD(P)H-flavin reductase